MPDVDKSQVIELDSLSDLIRLAVSRLDRMNRGIYLYYANNNDNHCYFTTQVVPGWYEHRGLPITMMANFEKEPESKFIEYKSATDQLEESWSFVDYIRNGANSAYIPIIRLKQAPSFML